jgi:hypothetical protein
MEESGPSTLDHGVSSERESDLRTMVHKIISKQQTPEGAGRHLTPQEMSLVIDLLAAHQESLDPKAILVSRGSDE